MPLYVHRDHPLPAPQDKNIQSPVTPAVTGIEYPMGTPADSDDSSQRGHAHRPLYTHHNIASSSIDGVVTPPSDALSLDRIWGSIRQQKERQMAKEKPKVQSLEEVTHELLAEQPTLTRQKSISSFRESTDGRSMVATFDLPPELGKQDVHLSFQRNRLVVTWKTIEVTEWEDEGVLMRERIERISHRTLPLPEGTRFEEIHAVMNGGQLMLRYPNMRCYRVYPRSRSGES